jgi:hypothetical protein
LAALGALLVGAAMRAATVDYFLKLEVLRARSAPATRG